MVRAGYGQGMSRVQVRAGVALGPRTTLAIGGPAHAFAEVKEADQLRGLLDWAAEQELAPWVLAGGSNVVISDAGFNGLVLRLVNSNLSFQDDGEIVRVSADAGLSWDGLVAACIARDLGGIECLSGIPGDVGAAPIQNIGAYGQDVSETLLEVVAYNRETNQVETLSNVDCEFSYRDSLFKRNRDRYIVTAVVLGLKRGASAALHYRDLKQHFDGRTPDLAAVRQAILQIRGSKSMLLDADDPNAKSAGSFFTNPIVSQDQAQEVRKRAADAGDGLMPEFKADHARVKLSAAWLIERAGFAKGYTQGRVGLSSKHCLALTNRGHATSAELIRLAATVRAGVLDKFAVKLVPEPVFVGFQDSVDDLLSASIEK